VKAGGFTTLHLRKADASDSHGGQHGSIAGSGAGRSTQDAAGHDGKGSHGTGSFERLAAGEWQTLQLSSLAGRGIHDSVLRSPTAIAAPPMKDQRTFRGRLMWPEFEPLGRAQQ
jgi:hypothetical protein